MPKKILIVDDDVDLCLLLSRFLSKNGYLTASAHSGAKGVEAYGKDEFDAVICDYRLGDMDGVQFITALKKVNPNVGILVITGYSDIKTAVEVIKMGAYDYITKPLIPDEVLSILRKLLADSADGQDADGAGDGITEKDNRSGRLRGHSFYKGKSPAAEFLYQQASIVAGTNYSVVLYGESGTGKEVIAQTIHELSPRRHKPFVALDCGTLSRELAGSELFGHVKGAFTGALQDKAGHFELAEGGTLFLDEVANLSPEVQAVLLRVIQERKYKRVGGNKEMPTDVRIVVASNEDLNEAYRKGKFREDLYHRFNEFSIYLPPLRERTEDIIPLAEFFLEQSARETGKSIDGFDDDVKRTFLSYPWPGNLREFRNVIRRAVLLTENGQLIAQRALPREISTYGGDFNSLIGNTRAELATLNLRNGDVPDKDLLRDAACRAEYDTIMTVLQQVNFNKKKAAELLKIDRKTLYNKLKNFQALQQN